MNLNYGIVVAGIVLVLASLAVYGGYNLADGWVRDLPLQYRRWFSLAMGVGGCLTVVYGLYSMKRDKDYLSLAISCGMVGFLIYAAIAQAF